MLWDGCINIYMKVVYIVGILSRRDWFTNNIRWDEGRREGGGKGRKGYLTQAIDLQHKTSTFLRS